MPICASHWRDDAAGRAGSELRQASFSRMGHAAATAGERIPGSAFSSDRLIVPAEPSAANRVTTLKQVCPLSEQSPNAGNYSPLPLRLQGKSKYLTAVDLPSSG